MDRVGHCIRVGFHRDGELPEDQRPDGNEDGGSAFTLHKHRMNTGRGELLVVWEDELEGLTLCNSDGDLTTKAQSDHI